jgi:uncharacterized protein YwqG
VSAIIGNVPSFDDQRRELSRLLRDSLPAERAARIEALIRDSIAITTRKTKKTDTATGASRLGGVPDLPNGSAWPSKRDGGVDFVGQLRLEDLAPFDIHHRLPANGLLSFFHGFLTNGEYEAEARIFYFPDARHGLSPCEPPQVARLRGRPTPRGIDFAPMALLPPHCSPLVPREGKDDPYVELFDTLYQTYGDEDVWFHGLFGFDRPREGEQRADEEVLLRLDANDAPYDFVEAACAYYFIPRADLTRMNLANVRLYEGASL